MIELIDSHCHLDDRRFAADRDQVIARAATAGVRRMITIGASGTMRANEDAVRLAAEHAGIHAVVGVHPHDASLLTFEVLAAIERLASAPKVVAVGETGLDYFYDHSPRPQQMEAFRLHIQLARRLKRPIVVHLRDAYADAARILREEKAGEVGGVLHCFSGDRRQARVFLDLGFDLSFSGIVTFKNADELRAVAADVPADRFLVETDAPYLAPVPHRGKRNEPAFVVSTAALIAEVRGVSLAEVAAATTANAVRRFELDGREPSEHEASRR